MDMRKYVARYLILVLLAFVLIGLQPAVLAHAQAGYDLNWWTVDGGGVTSPTGVGYSLGGTVGQADAATWQGGNGYLLSGGFWGGDPSDAPDNYEIYLPLVMRDFGP